MDVLIRSTIFLPTLSYYFFSSFSQFYVDQTLVKQASDRPNTKIVSLEWLLDSVEAKKKVKETQYLVAATPKSKDITNGKKRARAESVGNDKPSQALDGNNKQEPPAKKQKHGQKAKSESIRIPIDEGCPLDRKCYPRQNASHGSLDLAHQVRSGCPGVHR